MKIELWNGHAIRFVEHQGAWWAVAQDICEALGHTNVSVALGMVDDDERAIIDPKKLLGSKGKGGAQSMNIVSETGIYVLVIRSNLPEAKAFRKWVCQIVKSLRETLGYEQYRIMAFMDSVKNHHLNMDLIKEAINPQGKVPYVKAHSITNKCIANIVGEEKAIGKDDLKAKYPDMIPLRDEILTAATELMAMNERYNLGLSVSQALYTQYGVKATAKDYLYGKPQAAGRDS